MKRPRRLTQAFRLFLTLASICLALTVAYYLTAFIFARILFRPSPLAALIINAILGILLLMFVIVVVGVIFRPRQKSLFAPIAEALDRIATGDFTTRLDEDKTPLGPIRELARSVNLTAARLDQLDKMRQEFVSNVSHEIQSPLTSIRGFASALRDETLSPADRRHYLDIIDAETQRLTGLSSNLLRLASLESGHVELAPRRYRLDRQIRDLVLACETQWNAKGLDLQVELPESDITADEELLAQVWTNLIHNAIKFTPNGGTIRIGLRRRGQQLEFTIANTGIGIALEDQSRIFERFYKADRSRQSAQGGSGLGLAITRRIVQMHRGAVSVHSRVGEGAEFLVTLPV